MKLLLTGATGLLGTRIAHAAFERGHSLVILARNPDRVPETLGIPCTTYRWDTQESRTIPETAFDGIDAVIHLAGEPIATGAWTEEKKTRILDSRVQGTRVLHEALSKRPEALRPKTWISASAIGIYGDREATALTEDSAVASSDDFLAHVCREWESASQGIPGVRTVNPRFGIILAEEGGALGPIALPFRFGVGGRIGSGKQWMSWVHIEDALNALFFLLEAQELSGPVNVTAPEPVTNARFTELLAKTLTVPALFRVPKIALTATLHQKSQLLLASQKALPKRLEQRGFEFKFPQLEHALEDLLGTERFESVQWIGQPVGKVFRFFSDAGNLEKITPAWLGLQVIGTPARELSKGSHISYRLRVHRFPIQWESEIDRFDPDRSFRDVQVRGPYALWEHTHSFLPVAGGTLIKDSIRYRAPVGVLGRAVGGVFLKRELARLFEFRKQALGEMNLSENTP